MSFYGLPKEGQPSFAALTYPPAPALDLGHCSLEPVAAAENVAQSLLVILEMYMTMQEWQLT